MHVDPQTEHKWLDTFVGQWTSEMQCFMGPDQSPVTTTGREVVRSLGGLWVVAEGEGTMPDGGTGRTIMTLGYDPQKSRYVGSFIGSMMTHLWVYCGSLDSTSRTLTLETEGPDFTGSAMAHYKDVFELVDRDHRILTSHIRDEQGNWTQFMTGHYRRTPSGTREEQLR